MLCFKYSKNSFIGLTLQKHNYLGVKKAQNIINNLILGFFMVALVKIN